MYLLLLSTLCGKHGRLDCSTLFWGGDTFAPSLKVQNAQGETVGIQTFLQDAFLKMVDKVVESVGDLPGVLGFEVSCHFHDTPYRTLYGAEGRAGADNQLMNEPHPGYIGSPSINEWASFLPDQDRHLPLLL